MPTFSPERVSIIRFGVRAVNVEPPPEPAAPTVDENAPEAEPIEIGVSPARAFTERRTEAAETAPSRATSSADGGNSMSATPPVLMPSAELLSGTTPPAGGCTAESGVSTGSPSGASAMASRSMPRSESFISTDVTSPLPPATTIVISPDSGSA